MKGTKKEYTIEQSPFFDKNVKLRASLKELDASNDEIVLARKRYYKPDDYVKFIIESETDILKFHNISNLAKTILNYILCNCLEYNTPTFRLKASDITVILKLTDVSYVHKALRDLISIKYISRTRTKEVYWINHNKFYKGNYINDKYLKSKK